MLSNVKTQIEGIGGWLGSSIPKLRKGEEGLTEGGIAGGEENLGAEESLTTSADVVKGPSGLQKDEDDNSR